MAGDKPDFFFVDESGDPGTEPGNNPLYLLAGLWIPDPSLDHVRLHLANFRYQHGVTKELKGWGSLLKDKPTAAAKGLLETLALLTEDGLIQATTTWLVKDSYRAKGGPHLDPGTPTIKFRNYQLRRLLHRQKARGFWSDNIDLVVDRWSMNDEQQDNLRKYLKDNLFLQPALAHVTIADSAYVDPIQIADIYARIARRVVEGKATDWWKAICGRLMELTEIEKGLY